MKKVSFDFDNTLSNSKIQDYAISLINGGVEVWICTSRMSCKNAKPKWNDDLFSVALKLKIPRSRIIFCENEYKIIFLKGKNFIWHLDDDWLDLNRINEDDDLIGISCFGNKNWKKECNYLLL